MFRQWVPGTFLGLGFEVMQVILCFSFVQQVSFGTIIGLFCHHSLLLSNGRGNSVFVVLTRVQYLYSQWTGILLGTRFGVSGLETGILVGTEPSETSIPSVLRSSSCNRSLLKKKRPKKETYYRRNTHTHTHTHFTQAHTRGLSSGEFSIFPSYIFISMLRQKCLSVSVSARHTGTTSTTHIRLDELNPEP